MNEKLWGKNPKEVEKNLALQKERTISDAHLLKTGADYSAGKNGELLLIATRGQKELAKKEMEIDKLGKQEWLRIIKNKIIEQGINQGDSITIYLVNGDIVNGFFDGMDHGMIIYYNDIDEPTSLDSAICEEVVNIVKE